jgi:hypothetical protein
MIRESRSTDVQGRILVSRRASDDVERAALRREATMLGLARHPGVIEVVRANPLGDELVTAAPSGTTLADLRGRPDEALRALSATCETVADLHALGIVHGAITAETILAAPGRPPVLGGFDRAGLAGEEAADGTVLRPADDVAALATMVGEVWASRVSPRGHRPRGAPHRGELERLLRDSAEGRTPPARRLARTLEDVLGPAPDHPAVVPPAAESGDDPAAAAPDDDPFARLRPLDVESKRRPPRLVALAAGVVGVASLTWGVLGLGSGSGNPPKLGAATTTTIPVASSSVAASSVPRPKPAAVLVADRGVLTMGGRRYLVGARDDQAIAAEWGCHAIRQVVLLRPATGELFVFTSWARAGHDVRAAPAGRVTPGSRLSSSTDTAGCIVARVTAPDGATHAVRVEAR